MRLSGTSRPANGVTWSKATVVSNRHSRRRNCFAGEHTPLLRIDGPVAIAGVPRARQLGEAKDEGTTARPEARALSSACRPTVKACGCRRAKFGGAAVPGPPCCRDGMTTMSREPLGRSMISAKTGLLDSAAALANARPPARKGLDAMKNLRNIAPLAVILTEMGQGGFGPPGFAICQRIENGAGLRLEGQSRSGLNGYQGRGE